ncbi:ATP-binding protein [Phenylobacterium sp.]|uniref:sensor histidine kinase n=1 Tax=Phenylobacterium sp. TaxID=1871053 RepID=UPI00301C79C7
MTSVMRVFRWLPREVVATVLGVLIISLRLAFTGVPDGEMPFALVWLGVLVAAWIGGFGPATVASAVGLAIGQYILVSGGKSGIGFTGLAFYALFSLILIVPAEIYHRMKRRRQADQRLLADMTERLNRTGRLNAMGELAGALAHELNQPLTAISNYAGAAQYLARNNPTAAEDIAGLLDKIVGQTERSRGIISGIRRRLAGQDLQMAPESLSAMFEEAAEIALPSSAREPIAVRYAFHREADRVMADRIQIQQVMVNLVRNAAEAMAGSPHRELRIGSKLAADGLVECYVADRGPGVSPAMHEKLFQPFATDKAEGMGVGLAMSRTIVEAHGGRISADPNPVGGAIFRFGLRPAETSAGGS